jgi:hypothetical protein
MSASTLRESTKTAVIAITAAAIGVAILSGFTAGTPDVITQLTFGVGGFVVSGLGTLVALVIPSVRSSPVDQRKRIIWLSASCSGLTFLLISWLVLSHNNIK